MRAVPVTPAPPLLADYRPVWIDKGWELADLDTVEDCDRAIEVLGEAIESIEDQLADQTEFSPTQADRSVDEWRRRALGAMRAKRFALSRVQARRRELGGDNGAPSISKTDARRMLSKFREINPAGYADLIAKSRAAGLIA